MSYTSSDTHILDNLLEGFQLIGFDWRYRYVNETVARQGKSSREALLGRTMMEAYPGIEYTPLFRILERCMASRVADRMENEFIYPDGTKAWFELRIEPVSEGLFILSLDISERKKMEEALRRLNESLEEKVALRTAELEIKNKDITDSLCYAKRIQYAKLPPRREIHAALPQSFILFKPKAIVSGDFYFFHRSDEEVYLASADCTGHGVPGALLSMLCHEKLSDALLRYRDPSEILRLLNMGIRSSLRQFDGEDVSRDGMDIALCAVHPLSRSVTYAGANRPLWLVRHGCSEVEVVKSTRRAIGGFTDNDQLFVSHRLNLQPGDTFYIFTDGYADTFGGLHGKKLTTKRFRQLLLDIQHKPMCEQQQYLDHFIEQWRGDTEQVDDILVIGVRL